LAANFGRCPWPIGQIGQRPGKSAWPRPNANTALQLAISKGLKVVENLVSRTKQLINFFSTQKQIERLIKVQKDIGYEEPLHLVQDISTR
jgi:hypothetical protein